MPFVTFDNIAREWRCKFSTDSDNASLMAAQAKLEEILPEVSSVEGAASVQRIVCGGCHDFKVITKLPKASFEKWEKEAFAPEADFLKALKEGGKRGVEIEGAADMGGLQFFCTSVDEPE